MSVQPLRDLWDSASGSPYEPFVSKNNQFTLGFSLLAIAFLLSGYFTLNPSLVNVPAVGIPASLAFGFGAVYMICAVGVYV